MRRHWTIVTLALLAALLLVLTACDQRSVAPERPASDEAGREDAGDATTDASDDDEGPAEGEATELPDGWPADAPVYEGDIIEATKDGDTYTVGIKTSDAAQDVLEWYRGQFADGGWTIMSDQKSDIGGTVMATKSGVVLNATAGEIGGGTIISLTLMPMP